MKARLFRTGLTVAAALAIWACETKNPNTPTTSFGAPLASGPSNGQTFKFNAQPVTLTITNSPRTGPATVTYNVEVASDSGFANKVFNKEAIPEGSGGTTTVTVSNLNGGATYYWHWKAVVDGIVGQPSSAQAFNVQQQVTLSAPSVADPAGGATVSNSRPTFTTRNVGRSGPAGSITYEFQVSNNFRVHVDDRDVWTDFRRSGRSERHDLLDAERRPADVHALLARPGPATTRTASRADSRAARNSSSSRSA